MKSLTSSGDHQTKGPTREAFVFPASFAQRRLWFLHEFDPTSSVYNIPTPIRVTVPLDVVALRRTVNEIVRRHESLRTTFTPVDGEPMQVVAPAQTLSLDVSDLRSLPVEQREPEAQRLALLDAQRPFSLTHGPLLRVGLLRLGDADYVLLLTMHHIVSDGWSMGVFFRELGALYAAFSVGRPSPLPELSVQYPDFAHWQRQWLQGEVLERHLAYWKEQLAGAPELLDLPTDRPRPAFQSYHGGMHALPLEARLYEAVRALGQRAGMTPFMTLLAAFKALLHRYTGETDLVVGTPIANRTRPEVEGLIGLFVNTLVLRTDLAGDPTFRQLLARVREVTLGAYAHQDLPFEKLVEELGPARTLAYNPLFQVMFVLQSAERSAAPHPSDAGSEPVKVSTGTAKFDLTLSVMEAKGGAGVCFEYNSDLFDKTTIGRLADHFRRLLQAVVCQPDWRLSDLPLLSDAERQQLLVEWNRTETRYPTESCVHELFERQVDRTPEMVAVVSEDERLTYAEVNARANRLAHALREAGVGPEALVGVCLERSVEMVVGLLGVLKAGGAYLPLPPAYPEQRLVFMLEDARVQAVITQQRLLGRLSGVRAPSLCLDADREQISHHAAASLAGGARPGNLAYVLYTSGSTGRPKGVAIQHRSAVAFLHWARETFGPDELAGVLASTSFCFDLSVFELFAPLCWGGRVILAEDALQLPALAAAGEVRLINTVPSVMAELVRIGGVPESVRTVNLAGEPLSNSLVQQIYQPGSVQRVWNLYGPTEDTTYSTYAAAAKGSVEEPRIGRPLANKWVYLLDGHLQPVPVGVAGELYIGGAGLARGYLNRPELTAEQFIPDPFSLDPGARLYRTRDRARYLPDGQLQYLGRIDHQVKVRGYRIELGEVEAALREQAGVGEAIVAAREDPLGDKRLVAYLVAKASPAPSASELRRALKAKLPDYMVPTDFVLLEQLPLLPNGKLDRRALPSPEEQRLGPKGADYVAPRTPVEQLLAHLFGETLRRERVGVRDNFFAIGGHSLLATRVVARIHKAYGVALPLRRFFEAPTVEGLALAINESPQGPAAGAPPPIARLDRGYASAADVARLSDDEVAAMLETLLSEGKGNG
jgi:amino acid adenylation domain-containing protein